MMVMTIIRALVDAFERGRDELYHTAHPVYDRSVMSFRFETSQGCIAFGIYGHDRA